MTQSYASKMRGGGGGGGGQKYTASKPYAQQMRTVNPKAIVHTRKAGVVLPKGKK